MIYQIRIQGHLSAEWSAWFDGLIITNNPNGEALLTGQLPDQAALYGILNRLQSLNLPLLSLSSRPSNSPSGSPLDE
ncbi:MAG: hypothetical protein KJ077_29410 [Anaerolineae bacterium]|nr:hypothetical protein [Anaerolineae bacterium]